MAFYSFIDITVPIQLSATVAFGTLIMEGIFLVCSVIHKNPCVVIEACLCAITSSMYKV